MGESIDELRARYERYNAEDDPPDDQPATEPPEAKSANPGESSTRPLGELLPDEYKRLCKEAADHIANGRPSIHAMAKRYRITRRQVRNVIALVRERG